jgi:rhamnosyltransferase
MAPPCLPSRLASPMSDLASPSCVPPSAGSEVAGVVVLFHPDGTLGKNISAAMSQVGVLYVVDNTPWVETHDGQLPILPRGARLIHRGSNLGLGTAYNLACKRALSDGYGWVLLLDQDTFLFDRFMATMILRLGEHSRRALRPAGVAGPGFEYLTTPTRTTTRGADCAETEAVVSSGSLVCLRCWEEAGRFNDGFFIDYIDIDFCLRARAVGFAVVAVGDVLMSHGIGNSAENSVCGYRRMTSNYPPLRHYYITRNFVLMARARLGTDRQWLQRELVKRAKFTVLSVLMEPARCSILRSTARGVVDGFRGRLGQ